MEQNRLLIAKVKVQSYVAEIITVKQGAAEKRSSAAAIDYEGMLKSDREDYK